MIVLPILFNYLIIRCHYDCLVDAATLKGYEEVRK